MDECFVFVIFVFILHQSWALYLLTDYFMDQSQSRAFLGGCGKTLNDEAFYINSHVNTFHLAHYGNGRDCSVVLDAGPEEGARYKFRYLKWDLEPSPDGACTGDYLEVYDGLRSNGSHFYTRLCGNEAPNVTSFPVHRFLTFRFVTDSEITHTGFKILAVRELPPPCSSNHFYCESERRCLDVRLRCDGTAQCAGAEDESVCNVWERIVGGIMALGLAGIIGVAMGTCCVCLLLCLFCTCCCCRFQKSHKVPDPSINKPRIQRRGGAKERWEEVLASRRDSNDITHDITKIAADDSQPMILNPNWLKV